jgi:hypothetical protein
MGRVIAVAAVAVVMLAMGCGERATRTDASGVPIPPKRVRAFLGDQAVAVLSDPAKVEVYRVRDHTAEVDASAPAADVPQVAGYAIVSTAQPQDAAYGRKVAAIFLSAEPYQFGVGKACIFYADTVLRVHGRGGGRVDLVLCFTCSEFKLTPYDAGGQSVPGGGKQHFDAVAEKLKALVASAF